MPKDKSDKKEKKEKKVIGSSEVDDIEMADADKPKVCNKIVSLQFDYVLLLRVVTEKVQEGEGHNYDPCRGFISPCTSLSAKKAVEKTA